MARPRFETVYDLPEANRALAAEIGRAFRARPKDLPEALRKARRVMPKALAAELHDAVEMETWLGHPHWYSQIDLDQLQDLHARTRRFLDSLDLKKDRERYWLGIAASLTVNLVILGTLFVVVVRWRGLL